jgi:hypothetical protein
LLLYTAPSTTVDVADAEVVAVVAGADVVAVVDGADCVDCVACVDCVVAGASVVATALALDRTIVAAEVPLAPADLPVANSPTSPAVDATLSPSAARRARAAGCRRREPDRVSRPAVVTSDVALARGALAARRAVSRASRSSSKARSGDVDCSTRPDGSGGRNGLSAMYLIQLPRAPVTLVFT